MAMIDKTIVEVNEILPSRRRPFLVISSGHDIGTRIPLKDTPLRLGRDPQVADVVIQDDRISRLHCTVVFDGDLVLVKDLESTNGTFVNGERIASRDMAPEDSLQIGRTVFKLDFKDESEIEFEDQLFANATTDALTGVANRRYFMARARDEVDLCRRHKTCLCLVMMDLDHFKRVNDTYGHPAGDAVLKRFAEIVNESKRQEDLFGRYGGEEFVAMLRGGLDRGGCLHFCERVRAAVAGARFVHDGREIPLTVSLGMDYRPAEEVAALEAMVHRADLALYEAKKAGRNRVVVAP